MATYVTAQTFEGGPSAEEIQEMMVAKAHELFKACDKEEKGFICKRDMQRLQAELPLSPEQLEDVFDSLDDDNNGFLTLEEFTDGFGSFLGLTAPDSIDKPDTENAAGEKIYQNEHVDEEDEEETFTSLLEELGAHEVFEHPDLVKDLWAKLRREEPELLGNFEEFLARVTSDLKCTKTDYQNLETALRNKSNAHDEELRKLYDEMENQIKLEKERVRNEEKLREKQRRDELEEELREKDKQLQEMLQKHQELEDRLHILNTSEAETKQENEKLQKEKELMEELLNESEVHLGESRSYVHQLRNQQREEKRERAMAALQISEGIAVERESLVKQLDMLRDMNKKLRDDKDEHELKRLYGERAPRFGRDDSRDASGFGGSSTPSRQDSNASQGSSRKKLEKQGSVMSNYFGRQSRLDSQTLSEDGEDDGIEYDVFEHITSTPVASPHVDAHDINRNIGTQNDLNSTRSRSHLKSSDLQNSFIKEENGIVNNASPILKERQAQPGHTAANLETNEQAYVESLNSRNVRNSPRPRRISDYEEYTNDVDMHIAPTIQAWNTVLQNQKQSYLISRNLDVTDGHMMHFETESSSPKTKSDTVVQKMNFESEPVVQKMNLSSQTHSRTPNTSFDPELSRGQPVGATSSLDNTDASVETKMGPPERMFKVVFVGDSGVGKSSFIHRFCHNDFKATFSATIGVDFQIRNLQVEGHTVALQLWDTAGQERFRSITKQYFRKADGVLVMYDVTSETSFTNVRNWMDSVLEGVEEGSVMTIVGNKTDLCEDDEDRVVKTKDGAKLADEFGALFYETSAKSGINIKESLHAMACLLQEREDRQMEKALSLTDSEPKKKGCCK